MGARPFGEQRCYGCNEVGHLRRECPALDFQGAIRVLQEETDVDTNDEAEWYVHDAARRNLPRRITLKLEQEDEMESIILPIVIAGIPISALIDTGATQSVISRRLIRENPDLGEDVSRTKATHLKMATGKVIVSDEVAKVWIDFNMNGVGIEQDFLIITELTSDLILGADFLKASGAIVDYEKQCITMNIQNPKKNQEQQALNPLILESKPRQSTEGRVQTHQEYVEECIKKARLSQKQETEVRRILYIFEGIFCHDPFDLRPANLEPFEIKLTDDEPIVSRPYRASPGVKREIEKQVDILLTSDVIEPSSSPFSSPVVMAKKKDGEYRMCIDYRSINQRIKQDKYPIPLIQDNLAEFHGSRYFTTLNMRSGYHQLPLTETSKPKTAFACHLGLFQYRVLPFGLSTAPSGFQRRLKNLFGEPIPSHLKIYLDDLLVHSRSFEEHVNHVYDVLDILSRYEIQLKPKKCQFFKQSITYLGYVISEEGISTDPNKVKAIKEYPTPESTKEVRSFLGMATYYGKFIKGFSTIARPLHALTGANSKFSWSDTAQQSFQTLKEALTTAPVIPITTYPSPSTPMRRIRLSEPHFHKEMTEMRDR